MKVHICELNRAGLDSSTILRYQDTQKVKDYISQLSRGAYPPPIKLYSNTKTVADGIHRLCAGLFLGELEFEYINV